MNIKVEYDATIKRYIATVYNDAGAMVYKSVKAKRDAAVWGANNYIAYNEPSA